ncbi:MAG TPA: OsmC family protein [Gemmatimonadaceae bacterium]
MKITLTGEESLRLEPMSGPLTIEAQSHDQSYSPFHMLGSALGMCTFSVLQSWAANKNLAIDDLRIDVNWIFAEGQHRFDSVNVKLDWPSLSAELWPRAIRAAHLCGVHQTLARPFRISVTAIGAESPSIEAPLDLESMRGSGRSTTAVPQADGQPKATNAP